MVIIGISIPPFVAVLLDHYFKRKKLAAETERIKSENEKLQLQNKITKEITYNQLKTESKQKDLKGKVEIFSWINKLETEIKSKEKITASDQKKLEALEAIKKEFKDTLTEKDEKFPTSEPTAELEKNLETKSKGKKKRKIKNSE